jgi:hypothetical protein
LSFWNCLVARSGGEMGRFSFVLQVVIEFANRELLGRVRRFRRRKTTLVASLRRSCRDVCPNVSVN